MDITVYLSNKSYISMVYAIFIDYFSSEPVE